MKTVGVRELRERMNQILREVSQKGERIQVTHHGKVMAHLVPPPRTSSPEEIEQRLARLHQLSEEIGRHVVEETDASALMRDERR